MNENFKKMVEAKVARKIETRNRIKAAVKVIESELKAHGVYPENRGRLTIREVCRRAGVGDTTLRNQHHKDTRDALKDWLSKVRKASSEKVEDPKKVATQRVKDLENKVEMMSVEVLKILAEKEALLAECERMRRENLSRFAER